MNRVDFVCFTSKLCNLRCKYCYELPLLNDARRMSLAQVERMFEHVERHYRGLERSVELHFQWHGGEPLLVPPDEYRRFFAAQRRVFAGSHHRVTNGLQSNFTVIDDDRIALLRDFDAVGASLDLYSGLRVNRLNVCQESVAIENLDRVRAAGVAVSGITVLTRPNLERMADVYAFWKARGMGFRVLPVERGLYAAGQDFELGPREIARGLCALADLWLADEQLLSVAPLERYFTLVLHAERHPDNRVAAYDRAVWESVLLVDTDGSVYGYGDRFEAAARMGDLFTDPLEAVLASPAHAAVARASAARVAASCTGCPHYQRSCTGDPMADGGQDFTELDAEGRAICVVARTVIEHMQRRLREGAVSMERLLHTTREIERMARAA